MTFTTNKLGVTSSANSKTLADGVDTAPYNKISGQVVSSSLTEVVLDVSSSAVDDAYNGLVIQFISGMGGCQSRVITDYVGATKTATVSELGMMLNTTTKYVIHANSGMCGTQIQDNCGNSVRLKSTETSVDGFYNESLIKIIGENGIDQIFKTKDYDGTSKILSLDHDIDTLLSENSLYVIYGEGGVCPDQSGASTTTIILDGNQSTTVGTPNLYIEMYSGVSISQVRKIVSLVTDTLTVLEPWSVQPAIGDKYTIYGGWCGEYERCKDYSLITTVGAFNIFSGESVVIDMQLGLDSTGTIKRGKYAEASSLYPSTIHTLTVISTHYRLRIIGLGTEINGMIQTIFHTNKSSKLTSFIEENINHNNDCELTRSILVGKTEGGIYKNLKSDINGNLTTSIVNPTSSFGEIMMVNPVPTSQLKYTYGYHPLDLEINLSRGTSTTMITEGGISDTYTSILSSDTLITTGSETYTSGDIIIISGSGNGNNGIYNVFSHIGTTLIIQETTLNSPDTGTLDTSQTQTVNLPKGSSFSTITSNYFTMRSADSSPFYVWFQVSGSPDPGVGGTGIVVPITVSDTPDQVGSATQSAINANINFLVTSNGSLVTISLTSPGKQLSFDLINMPSLSNSSVNVPKAEAMLNVNLGTGYENYAVIRSRRGLRYIPGQGGQCRWSAMYDTPSPGISQWFGMSNSTSALLIGYDGTEFQIVRKSGGCHEIRLLEITSVAGASTGTVIITLDGIDNIITLSDVSSTQSVASQISKFDFSIASYNSDVVDNMVYFTSYNIEHPIGTKTFGFALGSAGSITTTFNQQTGANDVTTHVIPKYSWNIDRLNGSGPSGIILKPQQGNIYQIQHQWLGFGNIVFSVQDSFTGKFVPFHVIRLTNNNTEPANSKPSMKMSHILSSTTSGIAKTIKTSSSATFVEGDISRLDPIYSTENEHDNISLASNNAIMFAIKNPRLFNDLTSQIEIILRLLTITSNKSANGTKTISRFHIVLGGTPSVDLDFQYINKGSSSVWCAKPPIGSATLTGGEDIINIAVPADGTATVKLSDLNIILQTNSILYLIYSNPVPSTGNIDLFGSLIWVEDH